MLYSSLWARIQSQAAMTSLTTPRPSSSRTSRETRFARGSAPVCVPPPLAAMLAAECAVAAAVTGRVDAGRHEVHLREKPRAELAPSGLDT